MSDVPPSVEPVFEPPAPPPGTTNRKRTLIMLGVALVIVVFIFGFVLPSVIDYETVWETIKALDPVDFAVLIAAGLLLYVPEGMLYATLMPGMGLQKGAAAWVASTAVGTTIPGADLVVRFGMYRSWGYTVDRSMLGILLSGLFDNIVKWTLPAIAVIGLAVAGVSELGFLSLLALIALVGLVVMAVVVVGMVRSESFTRKVGDFVERFVNWGLAKFKRDQLDLSDRIVGFRDIAIDVVRKRGLLALLWATIGKLWAYVILVMALRMVGIESGVLSAGEIFIVWVIVLLITSIPITPGGIGIAELAYIWLFTQIAGEQYSDVIAAGVLLFRLVQWAMPIPIGWAVVYMWRRQINQGRLADPFAIDRSGHPQEES